MNAEKARDDYETHLAERAALTEAILSSNALMKLVVAGPGTGKSFLFQQICERNRELGATNNLALSFINELVDDLSRDLHQLAEVRTLHSFALGQIPREKNMFLKLGEVIGRDFHVTSGQVVDYNYIFCNLIDAPEELAFYSKRRKYYNFFGPHCSVYTLIKIFELDAEKIPEFSQILIDEFQDFNKLESTLLSHLAKRSPVLIVGDDDQSLYQFKYADPSDIRQKHASGEYATFGLPYCSRCAKVVIDAYAAVVRAAQANGNLQERVPKDYVYFPCEEKDAVSAAHPHVVVKREVFQNVIPYNIDRDIQSLFDPRASRLPTVLIICPLRKQIEVIEHGLRSRGFKNIDATQKYDHSSAMEGLGLLLANNDCTLGWRLVFEAECERTDRVDRFREVMQQSVDTEAPFKDLLTVEERRPIRTARAALRKIIEGKDVDEATLGTVFEVTGHEPTQIATATIRDELGRRRTHKNIYKNTPIKIVTMLGAKGLTRDYAFLVNFDDRFLLDRDDGGSLVVSDGSICRFLVSLTRARERVTIYTSKKESPTYLDWIPDEHLNDCT